MDNTIMKTLKMVLFITFLFVYNICGQNLILEWQSSDGMRIAWQVLEITTSQTSIVDFNDDGHPEIIIEGDDNSIKVYDIPTNQLIWEHQFTFTPDFVCFANVTDEVNKELIVANYPDVYMVNTSTFETEVVGTPNSWRNVFAFDIDQDGKDELILDCYGQNKVEIWGDGTTNYIKENKIVPSQNKLNQNFPNPFNPSTKIIYNLSKSGFVKINIYDVLGKLVDELVNDYKNYGDNEVEWYSKGLSSGRYFYQLTVDGEIVGTKKMVLLK